AHDGNIQDVSLELHEQIVFHHAAVSPQRMQFDFGILLHGVQYLSSLKSGGFEDRSRQMALVCEPSETSDDSAGIRLPIGRIQTGKCRDEIDPAVIIDASREWFNIFTPGQNSQIVAKPLN